MLAVLRLGLIPILIFLFEEIEGSAFNCEVIKNVTCYEIIGEKLFVTDSVIIQINNRTGETYSQIRLNYHKNNPVTQVDAWIENCDGAVLQRLKSKDFTDVNAVSSSFYSDEYSKKFSLKYNDYPYRICYTYKQTFRQFFSIGDWCPVFKTDMPTREARLIFIHPESYKVNIRQKNIGQPEIIARGEIVKMIWNTTYDGNIHDEVFCPSSDNFLPNVCIEPLQFVYHVAGENISWQTFGKWQYDLIRGLDQLPDKNREAYLLKILNIKDKKEIVRQLYHYLQDNTRYIDVYIGSGGLKPYPASYVSENHYGDCKALTIYMKALLKSVGIESIYALVYASNQPREIDADFPSQVFNHAILAVPVDQDTIWLENTNNFNPFGYTGTYLQNRSVLLIDEVSNMVKIPALTPADVLEIQKHEFYLDSTGAAKIHSAYVFKGRKFEEMNSMISGGTRDEQNKYIHDYLPFPDFDLSGWRVTKTGRDQRNVILESSISVNKLAKKIGNEFYFSFQPARIPEFEPVTNRNLPVQMPYPMFQTDTLVYHFPKGTVILDSPKPVILKTSYGEYSLETAILSERLLIIRKLLLNTGTIPLEEYKDFYSFISMIKAAEKQKILYQ